MPGPSSGAVPEPIRSPRGVVPQVRRALEGVSLRTRLVAILVAALLVALTATGYVLQGVLSRYLVDQIDEQLRATALRAANDRGARFFGDLVEGRRALPSPFVIQVVVDGTSRPIVSGGFALVDGANLPRFPLLTSGEAAALLGEVYTVRLADGSTWRVTSFRSPPGVEVQLPGGFRGEAAVTVGQSLGGVENAVAWLRLFTVLIGTGVILGCTALGWLLIRRSFRPLAEVEETAAAIAAGDLSRRIPERPATTEVGRLTASLNGMLTQIESAFRAQEASEARTRRFAADASHELRTPLAAIRGFAELHRQGAVPPEEVPRTMRRIEDEAKRMGSLVEDLLLLARLDEQRPGHNEPVDLAVLAGDAVHDARGLDADREVTLVGLDGVGPGPAVVIGDEFRLRQVVANLLANAVRHTPDNTPVEVGVGTLTATDGVRRAVLEVRDHGQGLTPEQAERVFERFYRVDSSRQRGAGGGSGLGLSIVAAVVAAHQGTIDVRTTPGGGATFRVDLPAGPDAAVDAARPDFTPPHAFPADSQETSKTGSAGRDVMASPHTKGDR